MEELPSWRGTVFCQELEEQWVCCSSLTLCSSCLLMLCLLTSAKLPRRFTSGQIVFLPQCHEWSNVSEALGQVPGCRLVSNQFFANAHNFALAVLVALSVCSYHFESYDSMALHRLSIEPSGQVEQTPHCAFPSAGHKWICPMSINLPGERQNRKNRRRNEESSTYKVCALGVCISWFLLVQSIIVLFLRRWVNLYFDVFRGSVATVLERQATRQKCKSVACVTFSRKECCVCDESPMVRRLALSKWWSSCDLACTYKMLQINGAGLLTGWKACAFIALDTNWCWAKNHHHVRNASTMMWLASYLR